MSNNVVNKQETIKQLLIGMDTLANVVKTTSGSKGNTFLIRRKDGTFQTTKDGVSLAKAITCVDAVQELGCRMLEQAANNTVESSGDGPQPLYAKVATPNGFVNMGDLVVGQVICGTNGSLQKVEGVFPKGEKEIYEVHFKCGRIVECCEDHLWKVFTYDNNKTLITPIKKLLDSGNVKRAKSNGSVQHGFYVPKTHVEFYEKELPIDPYLLGLLLGDGSLSGTGSIELSLGKNKEHVLSKIPKGFEFASTWVESKNYFRVVFESSIVKYLEDLGLYGVKSSTKFIPKKYLYSTIKQRKQLLQGLIDTDGYVNKRGLFEYSTISETLKNNFIELCRGLGLSTYDKLQTKRSKDAYSNTPVYRIAQLQGYKYGEPIIKIIPTGKMTPMQCIKVSNDDHLYITDNYIVTHNTTCTITIAQKLATLIFEQMEKGIDHTLLLSEIEDALKEVLVELKKQRKKITNVKQCINVATIALNGDKFHGKMIGETVWLARKNGVVQFEESDMPYTEVVQQYGSRYERPYQWKELLGKNQIQVAYDNPIIQVFAEDVETFAQINHLIEFSTKENRPLVLIATGFANIIVQNLIANNKKNNLKVLPLVFPGYGDDKIEMAIDIDAMCREENVYRVLADKFGFTLFTHEFTPAMEDRSDFINKQINDEPTKFVREQLERRLSILNQKVFTVHVGAPSNVEMLELKDRIEDALFATRASVEDGYLLGGGLALYNTSLSLSIGGMGRSIIEQACQAPYEQILINAKKEIEWHSEPTFGFNTTTMRFEDFDKAGIYDAYRAIEQALVNAVSVVKTVISLNGTILDDRNVSIPQFREGQGFVGNY